MSKLSKYMCTGGRGSRLYRVQRSLDALEAGKYSELDIHQCCDYIGWLAKWNKVTKEVWEPLCEQATRILDSMR